MESRGFRYKLLLQKSYFDKGLGLTNYFKYFLALFALASRDINYTLLYTLVYAIFCYILGYLWYRYGWTIIETEVGNNYNQFVIDMRKKLRKSKRIK